MNDYPFPPEFVLDRLRHGVVIPAHPLALTGTRALDERRQRALTRYYHAAGAGGIAVGVHTTQFDIRLPQHGLLRPVLELAAETVSRCEGDAGPAMVRIAGVCGPTTQAVAEASLARELGYHAGLLSLAAFAGEAEHAMIAHAERVARELPLVGFYLQPAVGGPPLSVEFWRAFAAIPNVLAIKIAPFDRYRTLDVVRAVAEVGRAGEIALYTGNDDAIVADLVTPFAHMVAGVPVAQRIVGGLLGQWAVWTRNAVAMLDACHQAVAAGVVPASLLARGARLTEANAVMFDAANNFAGCIPGISEVLRRQGLLANTVALHESEVLSPGQAAELDRIARDMPELADDAFVRQHLDEWLA